MLGAQISQDPGEPVAALNSTPAPVIPGESNSKTP